ncbi:MAG TPA: acyltransferase [Acidobacteriaceae bacterium]|nr:acyltransferase [Acidobacteriaceae bacterium]
MDKERRKPLPALTGIRILAAYYVVMLHTGSGYLARHGAPRLIVHFLERGYLAVSLFFVLSGFILAYTYQGKMSSASNATRFWEARFARIYPTYLLALALMFPFSLDVTRPERWIVLLMAQTWMPWRPELFGAWNFPAWSLSVEAFFYLCFPATLLWLSRWTTASLRILAGLLLAIIAVGNLARAPENWIHSGFLLARHLPLPVLRLPEFVTGTVLGLIFLRSPGWKVGGLVTVLMAVLSAAGLCLLPDRWASLSVAPLALLILGLASQRGPLAWILSTRIAVLLGGASYAVYLLQLPVRIYTRLAVAELAHAPQGLDAFLSPLVLLLLSTAVFLFWEEPSRRFLRKTLGLRSRWKWPYLQPGKPLE